MEVTLGLLNCIGNIFKSSSSTNSINKEVELNKWGVLVDIDIFDKDIFRCGNPECGKLGLHHGGWVEDGIRTFYDAFDVQQYLRRPKSLTISSRWCLDCCRELSK